MGFNHLERFVHSCKILPTLNFKPQRSSLNGMVLYLYTANISSTLDKFSKNYSELFITIEINLVKDRYSDHGN